MSNINLLPWRDMARARQKKRFLLLLALLSVLTVVVTLAVNIRVHRQVAWQQERNRLLRVDIARLEQELDDIHRLKAQRSQLLERVRLFDRVQQRRNLPVRVFNQLPELVPPGVYLSSVNMASHRIELVGKTEAYERVARMIRQVEASGWLTEPRISAIVASDTQPVALSQFSMLFRIIEAAPEAAQ